MVIRQLNFKQTARIPSALVEQPIETALDSRDVKLVVGGAHVAGRELAATGDSRVRDGNANPSSCDLRVGGNDHLLRNPKSALRARNVCRASLTHLGHFALQAISQLLLIRIEPRYPMHALHIC